jgi:PAS domain S-box-containing protein
MPLRAANLLLTMHPVTAPPMQHRPRKHWTDKDAEAFSQMALNFSRQLGVLFTDAQGHITGWSEGCCSIVGYEAHEVLGKHFSLLFTPEDRARAIDEHELRTSRELGSAEDERWHLRKDGARFWGSGVTLPILADGSVRGYIKTFKDATHLRVRMKSLENEVQQAAKSAAERNFFLASIAHELRNPLAPLKSLAQLLAKQDTLGLQGHVLKMVDRQLGFLERLVEDLVDLARVEAGKLHLEYHTVGLQPMLRLAVQSCQDRAESAGVDLKAVLSAVPVQVEVDPDRMHQVIVNLLNNAIKFTPSGGSVVLLANVDQSHFLVQVKDTGKGIGPHLLPRIFDMFTQAEGAGSHRGEGLGVGLALVKQIVSLHQGSVEVRSEGEGKGSEFIVRIPLRQPRGPGPEPLGQH